MPGPSDKISDAVLDVAAGPRLWTVPPLKNVGGEVEGTLPIAWHLAMPGNAIDTRRAGLRWQRQPHRYRFRTSMLNAVSSLGSILTISSRFPSVALRSPTLPLSRQFMESVETQLFGMLLLSHPCLGCING